MATERVDRKTISGQIDKAKEALKNTGNLYTALNGASTLLLAYRQQGGAKGWSQILEDPETKKPIYTPQEQSSLESSFKGMSAWLDPVFLQQQQEMIYRGGGGKSSYLHPSGRGSSEGSSEGSSDPVISYDLSSDHSPLINPDDISIDKAYNVVTEYIDDLDEKNRVLAKTLGPFRFINDLPMDPHIPLEVIGLPLLLIPARSIVPAAMTFLELLRLLVTFGPLPSNMLRQISSVVLAIADLASGSWKNALLTFAGVFGSTPLLLGLVGKLANNTFELMSPEVKVALRDSAFKGAKSAFIGGWLYLFSILSPTFVRESVNSALEGLEVPLEQFNREIQNLEEKTQETMKGTGLRVKFPKVPMDMLPSMDDIQNIQVLAARPEIYCSSEFQAVIDPLMKLVPLRLILELLGVPSQAKDRAKACATKSGSLTDAVVDSLMPTYSVEENVAADDDDSTVISEDSQPEPEPEPEKKEAPEPEKKEVEPEQSNEKVKFKPIPVRGPVRGTKKLKGGQKGSQQAQKRRRTMRRLF